ALWGVGRRLRSRLIGDALQAEHASSSPGFAATLNSVVDLCVLLISISVATMLSVSERPVEISFPEFVLTTFAAGIFWVAACAVLRHYDVRAFERDAVEDACLVTVLVIGLGGFLGVLHLVLPDSAAIPRVSHFLLVFWPGVLGLRLFVFRALADTQSAEGEAVISGPGPLGRLRGTPRDPRASPHRRVPAFFRGAPWHSVGFASVGLRRRSRGGPSIHSGQRSLHRRRLQPARERDAGGGSGLRDVWNAVLASPPPLSVRARETRRQQRRVRRVSPLPVGGGKTLPNGDQTVVRHRVLGRGPRDLVAAFRGACDRHQAHLLRPDLL